MPESKTPAASMRPEATLLLCCARVCMDSVTAARIRALLKEDMDWEYLLRLTHQHKMLPLLYWHLNAICPEGVPRAILGQLRNYFRANAGRNLSLIAELLKLLNLFESHGILAIPFKGPTLASSLYRNLALRQAGDLDILLHKQDVLKARDLLISQGYHPLIQQTAALEAAHLQSHWEYQLARHDGKITVELQWRVAPHWQITPKYCSFPLDLELLRERLESVSLAGRIVPSLAPEDLLLVLCVHGSKHLWVRLAWICDIAELIRVHPRMNWERIIRQARALDGERMLFVGLLLASDLLGTALPKEIMQNVEADSVTRSTAIQVHRWLFHEADEPPGLFEEVRFHLSTRKHWRSRIPYYLHYLRICLRTAKVRLVAGRRYRRPAP